MGADRGAFHDGVQQPEVLIGAAELLGGGPDAVLEAAGLEHAGRGDVQAGLARLRDMLGSKVGDRAGQIDHLREHGDPRAEVGGLLGDLWVGAAAQVVGHVVGLLDHAAHDVVLGGDRLKIKTKDKVITDIGDTVGIEFTTSDGVIFDAQTGQALSLAE